MRLENNERDEISSSINPSTEASQKLVEDAWGKNSCNPDEADFTGTLPGLQIDLESSHTCDQDTHSLSFSEFASTHFDSFDLDSNGAISKEELTNFLDSQDSSKPKSYKDLAKSMLKNYDELSALDNDMSNGISKNDIAKYDTNMKKSFEDTRAGASYYASDWRLGEADLNSDGVLSMQELTQLRTLIEETRAGYNDDSLFKSADLNKDGLLSEKEYDLMKTLKYFDPARDKALNYLIKNYEEIDNAANSGLLSEKQGLSLTELTEHLEKINSSPTAAMVESIDKAMWAVFLSLPPSKWPVHFLHQSE